MFHQLGEETVKDPGMSKGTDLFYSAARQIEKIIKGEDKMDNEEIMRRAYTITMTDPEVDWKYWWDQSLSYGSDKLLDRYSLKEMEDKLEDYIRGEK